MTTLLAACQSQQPAAPKPAETKPAETKPAESKPAEAKPAAPAAPPAATTAPAAAQSAPAKVAPGTEIRLHVRTGPEEDTLNELLPQFTQQTGIKVKLETFPTAEYFTKVQTLIAGGNVGDVLWTVNYRGTFAWANSKVIRPLDDLVQKENFDTKQYYPAAYEAGFFQGKLYGMPFKIHPGPVALYYNVQAAEAGGVKMPEKQVASWDDLIKLATPLTKSAGGRVEQYGFHIGLTPDNSADTWQRTNMYIRNFGGEMYSEDGKKSLMAEKPVKDAIRFMADLMFKHKVAATLKEGTSQSDDLFIAGRTALYQASSSTKSVPTKIKDKFQVKNIIMPAGPGGLGTQAIVDHIVMSATTKQPEAAWELMKMMCGKEMGVRLAGGTGGIASGTSGGRLDVLNDPRLMSQPLHPIFIDLLAQAKVVRTTGNFRDGEIGNVLHQLIGPVFLGERQPDDAFFDELHKGFQAVLDKPAA
ncbi:MAG: extracellular solute-binding protein [Chloroflexota bacterium]